MERTLTRSSHSRLQPVEIAKRLARVMDADQVVGVLGVRVPNIFDVDLSPADFGQFKPIQSSVTREVETYLSRYARDRLFVLASPPIVRLHSRGDLKSGEFGVRAQMEDIQPLPSESRRREEVEAAQYTRPLPVTTAAPAPAPRRHVSQLVSANRAYHLEGSPVTIGRSPGSDVTIDDRRVSRRHAQLVLEDGHWLMEDLGSTNGTAINGKLVTHGRLQDGDRLSLGGFELVFHE